jgi:dUTP pyrophosphatase
MSKENKTRGFEVVAEFARTAYDTYTDEKKNKHKFEKEITLPSRGDIGSAGYDFYVPKDIEILPHETKTLWTDVKAYMQTDEVLLLCIRSSLAIKQGLVLTNAVGVIDSSYYSNEDNDGNIAVALTNNSGKKVVLKEGERVMQGIFTKYLLADEAVVIKEKRVGGIGSSGK